MARQWFKEEYLNELVEDSQIDGLEFWESKGSLKFVYRVDFRNARGTYAKEGIVPSQIVEQGKYSILSYVQTKMDELGDWTKKQFSIEADIKENPIPIQTQYKDGTPLEGRITEATDRHIKVKLDKPLEGEGVITLGYQSRGEIFEEEHKVSEKMAHRALRRAYQKALEDSE